jgi:hypothetical protein
MKQILFVLFCTCIQLSVFGQVSDSFIVSGIVRTNNNRYKNYPIKSITNAVVKIMKRDSVLYATKSNDTGGFYLKCSKNILKDTVTIEVSALNNQKRVTFDSICPYLVLKTPSGYQDYSSFIIPSKLKNDTIHELIVMQAPLICHNNFELYFPKDSINPSNYDIDTLCMCLNNQIKGLLNLQKNGELQILSLYSNDSVLAIKRAERLKELMHSNYQMPLERIKINVYQSEELNNFWLNNNGVEYEVLKPLIRIYYH